MLRILTLRLIVLSLILTLVFIALIFSIMITQWRDLPSETGSIVFQTLSQDSEDRLDLLLLNNALVGEQFEELMDPLVTLGTNHIDSWDCSADGKSLLVYTQQYLYLLNIQTKTLKQVTSVPRTVWSLAWSSNQKRVAFVGNNNNQTQGAIYSANVDGSMIVPVALFPNNEYTNSLSWSPDGREITYNQQSGSGTQILFRIALIDIATHVVKQVYQSANSIEALSWSPDGKRIAFVMDEDPNYVIYTIQPDGSNLTQLTNNHQENAYPRWSPDGSLISYSSLDASGHYQLYVMNADGSDQHLIFVSPRGDDAFNMCWLPAQKETS